MGNFLRNKSPTHCPVVLNMAFRTLFVVLAVIFAICAVLDGVKERWYLFDQNQLHQVAKAAIAHSNDTAARFQFVVDTLYKQYPKNIMYYDVNADGNWMFNNAGGAMGSMLVLHTSITEYLIIFGTAIGTEGHTGRFWADDYFMMLKGKQYAYYTNSLEKIVFREGELHHLARGTSQGYKIPDEGGWALEYARGWIPLMLPFGFGDAVTSTLDFVSVAQTVYIYGKGTVLN